MAPANGRTPISHEVFRRYKVEWSRPHLSGGCLNLWHILPAQEVSTKRRCSCFIFEKQAKDRDSRILQCLRREAQLLGTMQHAAFLTVLEPVVETASHLFYITENMRGPLTSIFNGDYMDWGDEPLALSDLEMRCGLYKICTALQHLHSSQLGLCHKRLSMDSVFVTQSSEGCTWKLGGLGFADALAVSPENPSWISMLRTRHSPPEVMNGEPCTAQTDVYGVAGLLADLYAPGSDWPPNLEGLPANVAETLQRNIQDKQGSRMTMSEFMDCSYFCEQPFHALNMLSKASSACLESRPSKAERNGAAKKAPEPVVWPFKRSPSATDEADLDDTPLYYTLVEYESQASMSLQQRFFPLLRDIWRNAELFNRPNACAVDVCRCLLFFAHKISLAESRQQVLPLIMEPIEKLAAKDSGEAWKTPRAPTRRAQAVALCLSEMLPFVGLHPAWKSAVFQSIRTMLKHGDGDVKGLCLCALARAARMAAPSFSLQDRTAMWPEADVQSSIVEPLALILKGSAEEPVHVFALLLLQHVSSMLEKQAFSELLLPTLQRFCEEQCTSPARTEAIFQVVEHLAPRLGSRAMACTLIPMLSQLLVNEASAALSQPAFAACVDVCHRLLGEVCLNRQSGALSTSASTGTERALDMYTAKVAQNLHSVHCDPSPETFVAAPRDDSQKDDDSNAVLLSYVEGLVADPASPGGAMTARGPAVADPESAYLMGFVNDRAESEGTPAEPKVARQLSTPPPSKAAVSDPEVPSPSESTQQAASASQPRGVGDRNEDLETPGKATGSTSHTECSAQMCNQMSKDVEDWDPNSVGPSKADNWDPNGGPQVTSPPVKAEFEVNWGDSKQDTAFVADWGFTEAHSAKTTAVSASDDAINPDVAWNAYDDAWATVGGGNLSSEFTAGLGTAGADETDIATDEGERGPEPLPTFDRGATRRSSAGQPADDQSGALSPSGALRELSSDAPGSVVKASQELSSGAPGNVVIKAPQNEPLVCAKEDAPQDAPQDKISFVLQAANNFSKRQQELSVLMQTDDIWLDAIPVEQKMAAMRIQAVYRGRTTRRELQQRARAVARIQARQKGRMARQELQRSQVAATKIQALRRGCKAKQEFRQWRRNRADAATRLQTHWRYRQGLSRPKDEASSDRKDENDEKVGEGPDSNPTVDESIVTESQVLSPNRAALRIQSGWRIRQRRRECTSEPLPQSIESKIEQVKEVSARVAIDEITLPGLPRSNSEGDFRVDAVQGKMSAAFEAACEDPFATAPAAVWISQPDSEDVFNGDFADFGNAFATAAPHFSVPSEPVKPSQPAVGSECEDIPLMGPPDDALPWHIRESPSERSITVEQPHDLPVVGLGLFATAPPASGYETTSGKSGHRLPRQLDEFLSDHSNWTQIVLEDQELRHSLQRCRQLRGPSQDEADFSTNEAVAWGINSSANSGNSRAPLEKRSGPSKSRLDHWSSPSSDPTEILDVPEEGPILQPPSSCEGLGNKAGNNPHVTLPVRGNQLRAHSFGGESESRLKKPWVRGVNGTAPVAPSCSPVAENGTVQQPSIGGSCSSPETDPEMENLVVGPKVDPFGDDDLCKKRHGRRHVASKTVPGRKAQSEKFVKSITFDEEAMGGALQRSKSLALDLKSSADAVVTSLWGPPAPPAGAK